MSESRCSFQLVLQVLVKAKNYSRADIIPQSSGLKQVARSVGRRSHPAIARQVMRNPKTRTTCLTILEKDIQKDLSRVASMKGGSSCLRRRTLDALQSFSWEKFHLELKQKAPTLYRVLQGCVNVRRRERGRGRKTRKTHRAHNSAVLGICAAVLLRHRNQHLNVVQRIVSLILHSGHAGKQVCAHFDIVIDCYEQTCSLTFRYTDVSKKFCSVFLTLEHWLPWMNWARTMMRMC